MSAYEMKQMGSVQVDRVDGNVKYGAKDSQTGVRRIFSFTQMYFFALSYMSSWEAMATNIGLVFYNGGPRALVWGFLIVIPGVLCQVASLAEMASMFPIAGVQYHFTWELAPPQHRRFLTWVQGWITWFSWVALLAGITNIAANVTTTIVAASYPGYTVQSWQTILVMYAYLIVLGLLNMYGFFLIPWIEFLAGLLHVILWIVFAAVLLTLAPRHSSHFVWLEKANLSGWESDFVSFNLGLVLITWGFVGFDAVAHISEETRKARSTIPRTMFWSISLNAALAFGMVLIFLYCLGDVSDVATASYPLMGICLAATKSVAGASAMVGALLCTVISGTLGSVASVSRLTWAWARDGALPSYFAYVSPRYRIPLRSVWLPIILVMLLSLLNLANYTAFSVIISLSTFGLYQSYFIATACMLQARLSGRIETAPWSLGRWGIPINIFALLFSAWLGIFMVFPSYLPITAAYMNYALPINVFIWMFAIVLWFAWGKNNWKGLNNEIIEKVVADGDRDTKD
ncbi:hypothetical protein LTR37_016307 [Vermiconidia calcicola]|uniref:Uncharacterized protein n=1 Tax=Vermiconidia calcicola TaxID=1690605 RepID=A0ACC3MPP7_9PEZI|nr:hypothetical protein LTR37_016307 [Vermiconidia calcicola]